MNDRMDFMERTGPLSELDRSFDIEYWQRQGPQAIFEAAWEMVVEHFVRTTGKDASELRLDRTVESFRSPRHQEGP